MTDVELC